MVWPVIFVVFCAIFWTNNFFGQTISFQNKIAIFFNASEEKFHKDSHNQRYYNIKICDDRRLVVTSSFAFYVITFEPIEVQTHSAPQNDRLNLSFEKNIKNVDFGKFDQNTNYQGPNGFCWYNCRFYH
jgi:hypothetical protein